MVALETHPNPRNAIRSTAILLGLILALWLFPVWWYNYTDPTQKRVWLSGQTQIDGWTFQPIPVAKSAEAVLVADHLISGEFTQMNRKVRVFIAKRYEEKSNDIGLFVHTPDRCWVQAGWQITDSAPDVTELNVHGVTLKMERRVFISGVHRELVYFGGLIGGQPLVYRLDHNLGIGMKKNTADPAKQRNSSWIPDALLLERLWDSFASRLPLSGPKQFIRISTPVLPGQEADADALLTDIVKQWLQPGDYRQELAAWHTNKKQAYLDQKFENKNQ